MKLTVRKIGLKRLAIVMFLAFSCQAFAQQDTSACAAPDDRAAVKLYEKGTNRKKYRKKERMAYLKQALKLEPDYVAANFALAEEMVKDIIYFNSSFDPTVPYFMKVIDDCPHYHSDPYYYVGFSYYEDEKYKPAIKFLQEYLDFKDDDVKKYNRYYTTYLYRAKEMIKHAKQYMKTDSLRKALKAHPVPFDPKPLMGVDTKNGEYLPFISADGQLALYTRSEPPNEMNNPWHTGQNVEIFTYSKMRENGQFDGGHPMPPPFNQNSNEGGATLTIDNKELFYTICKNEGGPKLNCDIYYSKNVNGDWTTIQNMGPKINDPDAWDSQPSISADGKTLYFASSRKGGFGGLDIYKTVKDSTGHWGKPINLGPTINTSGNEKSPFIHSDSHTLYFSSDGLPGLGGYDIFYARKGNDGKWQTPVNIGYPINTSKDDLAFFVSTDGKYGYFASNDPSRVMNREIGGWDIYYFKLYKTARPQKVALITGQLKDQDGMAVKDASIEVKDATTNQKFDAVMDTTTGKYAVVVNVKKKDNFVITVNKKGAAFNAKLYMPGNKKAEEADNASAGNSQSNEREPGVTKKPVKINFDVKPITAGQTYQLNDIYYETNSAELKNASRVIVLDFAKFLKANPTVKVEIHGHTDNVGDEKSNMALSTDRAFTVYNLLLANGVSKAQLVGFKGFGDTQPVASNATAAGRAKNRRTEFVIVSK